ncbi:large conductance mechanosensitive channel protein [mine drainage metagenome]|uniref:Large conductance mechanosensitive channel protein n=1 Tax=mine drainage metagenome TaxID=410659 RepID=T0YDF7_9ZZZZ
MGITEDLKTFLTQANFVTLAVAFIVGAQVGLVVGALVTGVVDPLIGVFFKANFAEIGLVTVNGSTFTFGTLLGAIINFAIVLLVIFFAFIYPFSVHAKRVAAKKAAAPPTTKSCPFCCSTINIQASRCAFCTQALPSAAPARRHPRRSRRDQRRGGRPVAAGSTTLAPAKPSARSRQASHRPHGARPPA